MAWSVNRDEGLEEGYSPAPASAWATLSLCCAATVLDAIGAGRGLRTATGMENAMLLERSTRVKSVPDDSSGTSQEQRECVNLADGIFTYIIVYIHVLTCADAEKLPSRLLVARHPRG